MAGTKTVSRILMTSGILMMVVGAVGFFVMMMLNAFVLDEFDAYGEVPIRGRVRCSCPPGRRRSAFTPR
ncbi:hypothetical protein ACQ86B_16085 [Mycolicibacterium aichiense]|uniref:hypothetical protein n=1 Tax=Mycolicibacterium aichiense TaxID=1799 RepID=UPI003D66FD21